MTTKPIIAIICFLLINALCVYGGYQWADNSWQIDWDAHIIQELNDQQVVNEREFKLQIEWQSQIDKVAKDGKEKAEKLANDVSNLIVINDGLRKQIAVSTTKYESADTTIANLRRAAATTELVQRELLGYCLTRVEQLAGIAERSRQAGLNCEASYKSIRESL